MSSCSSPSRSSGRPSPRGSSRCAPVAARGSGQFGTTRRTRRGSMALVEAAAAQPRRFEDTTDWINRINPEWQFHPPVDLHGTAEPSVVEAASGHTFVVTLRVGPDLTIPAGTHLTMEVPACWDTHLGNTFRRGIVNVGN